MIISLMILIFVNLLSIKMLQRYIFLFIIQTGIVIFYDSGAIKIFICIFAKKIINALLYGENYY